MAPIIKPIAWVKLSKPALINPMTMTVEELLDCKTAVTNAPARTAITLLAAKKRMIFFMFSPAIFLIPSLIRFIPNTKRASPPKTLTSTWIRLNPKRLTDMPR